MPIRVLPPGFSVVTTRNAKPRELRGWKEIADYFDVSVRTAQLWERNLGMPVRRLSERSGRVYCLVEELETWRQEADPGRSGGTDSARLARRKSQPALVAGGVIVASVVGFAVGAWLFDSPPPIPRVLESAPLTAAEEPERSPDLSPDGRRIVFVSACDESGESCVWVRDLAGGPRQLLARGVALHASPQWSPDGRRVAFLRPGVEGLDVAVVDLDGDVESIFGSLPGRTRADNVLDVASIAWTADGRGVVYPHRETVDEPLRLYVLDAQGGRQALTSPPDGTAGDTQPEVSPDGRRLAFTRFTTLSESDIYVLTLPDGPLERLTEANVRVWGLSWVESRGLLYASHPGRGRSKLHWISLDGESSELSGPQFAAKKPSARIVGGGQIVLAYEQRERQDNLWSLDLRTMATEKVAPSTWAESFPACAAGGDLAFISLRSGFHEVWLHSPNHAEPTQLTELAGPYTDMPRWSPDGKRILFSSAMGPTRDVFVVDLATRTTRVLVGGPESEEGRGSWSRDGDWVYFRSDRSGDQQIWKQRVDGDSPAIQLTSGGGYEAFESSDGRELYFVRDRQSRELWSVPVDGGNERLVYSDGPSESLWAVAGRWVYFRDGHSIRRLDTATGATETVYELDPAVIPVAGFTVCPDRPVVYWGQTDVNRADIWVARLELP